MKFFVVQVYKNNDYVHFAFCPKSGNTVEGAVIKRVCTLGTFCPKQGQGFKPSAAHLF